MKVSKMPWAAALAWAALISSAGRGEWAASWLALATIALAPLALAILAALSPRREGLMSASDAEALVVAKAIAHSPLVKTAWAGSDPNWGRLMAAIGNSGAQISPEAIDIWFGELRICRDGGRAAEMDVAAAHAYLQQPEFSITIELHQGAGSCVFWTTDLTVGYVNINADYST